MGRKRLTALAVAAAAAVAAAGTALATGHLGGGTIQACAKKHSGALRLDSSCRSSEDPVSWNATGPAGPPGSALAYAYVENGALVPSKSKGVVSMTTATTADGSRSFYCFTLTAAPENVATGTAIQIDPDDGKLYRADAPGATVAGTAPFSLIPCPSGTHAAALRSVYDPTETFFLAFN